MNHAVELNLKEHVTTLADRGNSYAALPLLEALKKDASVEAQVLFSRVVRHLGNGSRSRAIDIQLWRQFPEHPEAMLGYARILGERRGLYHAWRWTGERTLPAGASATCVAEWHSLRGSIAAGFRDWESAGCFFAGARELMPDSPWIWVEYAYGLALEDRYDEAIDAARKALALDPNYRSAVQALAHLLSMTDEDEAAIALLERASTVMQNADLEIQLFGLLTEHRRFDEAGQALDRSRTYSPYADRVRRIWFEQASAANLLARERYTEARAHCIAAADPFHTATAARIDDLTEGEAPRRVLLDVGFVRQHHMTCSPATLSALSEFWGRPAKHLEIAGQICYDGTPTHSERAWSERNGFLTREFTVDWKVATALLDAGVPFALTTQNTDSGHLQAVIGYDTLRRTLLLRDPTHRIHTEFDADALFEAQRASGPRGMVMLPPEEAHRIAGVTLPDASEWDDYHAVMRALNQHDRDAAQAAVEQQQQQQCASDHWLTLWSQRSLACYDGDATAALALLERLIERFGERPELLLQRQQWLGPVGSRAEVLDLAERGVQLHPRNAPLLTRLAMLQTDDARELGQADRVLKRALRQNPVDAHAWRAMANVLWLSGDRRHAREHYRVAACLADMQEDFASAYARACRALGEVEQGLTWLAARQQRLGARSAGPTMTCYCELENLERLVEAFALVEDALRQRPDDEALRLFCAQKYLQHGEVEKARQVLLAAQGRTRAIDRLRVEAALALREGRLDEAWAAIADACEQEPLRDDVRRQAVEILAQRSGRRAVLDYLREACAQHRTVIALHALLLEWLAADPPQEREAVLRHILLLNGKNAFMLRELATNLASQQRLPEAWEAARQSLSLAPQDANTYAVLASLHFGVGEIAAGQAQCREALRRSIDQGYAFNMLVTSCNSHEERLAALEFIEAQLSVQATQGAALLLFQPLAKFSWSVEELEARLDALRGRRPELWQAWLVPALHRIENGKLADAQAQLEEAVERFPFTARLHYELARIAAMQRRPHDAREAVRRALQLEPAWGWAIRLYVDLALADAAQLESALALLDSPLSRSAESADCHALRGKVLWKMARREEAVDTLERALERWPQHIETWQLASAWTRERGETDRVLRIATRVAELHPHDVTCWVRLADSETSLERASAALARASALEPLNQLVYVARLNALLRFRQFDAVLEAVREAPWGERSPTAIRRYAPRALWLQQKASEAIDDMYALLAEEPNDFSLWQELADWLNTTPRLDEYRSAAREMVRLAPGTAIAHGHLGEALRKRGDIELAIQSLRTAFDLDHNYAFAGFTLADLLLQGTWQEAQPVLRILRERFPGVAVALRELRYAVASDSAGGMPQPLREIVRAAPAAAGMFGEAAKVVPKGHGKRLLLDAIRDACADGEASEPAIAYWLEREFDLADTGLFDQLEPYLKADRDNRLKRVFIRTVTQKKRYGIVPMIVERYGTVMRVNPMDWGEVSYGLVTGDSFREAIDWMHDWRRDDAPWWALDNLAIAMRSVGMIDVAHEVSAASNSKEPGRPDAMVWLAIDAALGDDLVAMRRYLDSTQGMELRPFYRALRDVVVAYRGTVESGRTAELRRTFARVRFQSKTQKTLARLMVEVRRAWVHKATGLQRLWRRVSLL
ncbi:tetratricopeptide repeat protein [Paraburkholderia sp. J12]|uniref:tetratricopeptide repeat protein n=1 Tax=Paraburkholderia sp. J12 TaxID=2805432 RepID=UPI002ABE2D62|nr:tetratricopeptide repeat protein [Paraburkholderia sp. J12]